MTDCSVCDPCIVYRMNSIQFRSICSMVMFVTKLIITCIIHYSIIMYIFIPNIHIVKHIYIQMDVIRDIVGKYEINKYIRYYKNNNAKNLHILYPNIDNNENKDIRNMILNYADLS